MVLNGTRPSVRWTMMSWWRRSLLISALIALWIKSSLNPSTCLPYWTCKDFPKSCTSIWKARGVMTASYRASRFRLAESHANSTWMWCRGMNERMNEWRSFSLFLFPSQKTCLTLALVKRAGSQPVPIKALLITEWSRLEDSVFLCFFFFPPEIIRWKKYWLSCSKTWEKLGKTWRKRAKKWFISLWSDQASQAQRRWFHTRLST